MNRTVKFSLGVALLATSVLSMSPVAPVNALVYPDSGRAFPSCSADSQEFCIQEFKFTPASGATRSVTPSDFSLGATDANGNPEVNVVATLSAGYAGLASTPAQDQILASLSLNFYDPLGEVSNSGVTKVGLRDGLYKVVVRTGDFDPSSMMLIGGYDSYEVVKGADGYFTVTLTVRPIRWAAVVQLNGNDSRFQACQVSNWVADCEANMAYQGYILATFNMLDTAALREGARGSWVSTNASVIQASASSSGQFNFTAKGPHFVPSDFGVSGLAQENGRSLNPAFFKMYVPYSMMAASMSQMLGSSFSLADVATYMATPEKFLTGTIWEASGAAAPVEVPQALTFDVSNPAGAVIDFQLKHFSAPNPSLKLKGPAVAQVAKTTTLAVAKTSKFTAVATMAKLAYSKTSKVSVVVAAASKKVCRVAGTMLKALKVGTCRVTVTVTSLKGKKTSKTVSLRVAK